MVKRFNSVVPTQILGLGSQLIQGRGTLAFGAALNGEEWLLLWLSGLATSVLGSGLQPCQPIRCGKHRDRPPPLLLPGVANDLHSLGFAKLRRETEQGPVG
jgi:hypothetical protein